MGTDGAERALKERGKYLDAPELPERDNKEERQCLRARLARRVAIT